MVMLERWPVSCGENGYVTEVVSLKEGEWSCYRGVQFNGEGMVMLRRWSVQWRENGLTEGVSLMVMLRRWTV